mgnify:CR=1 FL=1
MRLVLTSAVREHDSDFVARESAWRMSVLWIVLALVGAAWCAAPLLGGGPAWFGLLFGLPCVAIAASMARGVVRSWRSKWWILRVRRDGLALRLRSQLNSDLPDEWAHVVLIERQEVRRVVAERVDLRDLSQASAMSAPSVRLSFELASPVPAEVQRSLARELDPGMRGRTHFHACVASIEREQTLCVIWSGPSLRLSPGLKATMRELGRMGYPVERELKRTTLEWGRLDRAEREQRIDELVRNGDMLGAIRLWRMEHGGGLAEAKAAVERRDKRSAA